MSAVSHPHAGTDEAHADDGIDDTHPQFTGINITRIFDAYKEYPALGNHGTHCAGTVLGKDYGAFRAEIVHFWHEMVHFLLKWRISCRNGGFLA